MEDGTIFEEMSWDDKGRMNTLFYKESADLDSQFKYDDKKGLFSSVNSPFFFDAFLSTSIANFNINNLTEVSTTYKDNGGQTIVEKTTYTYVYNDDGYPVTIKAADNRDGEYLMIQIEYKEIK